MKRNGDFYRIAAEAFEVLLREHSFRVSAIDATSVTFTNGAVELSVFHDSPGDVVDACVRRNSEGDWIYLETLSREFEVARPYTQAFDAKSTRAALDKISSFFQCFGPQLFLGDETYFSLLEQQQRTRDHEDNRIMHRHATVAALREALTSGDYELAFDAATKLDPPLSAEEAVLKKRVDLLKRGSSE